MYIYIYMFYYLLISILIIIIKWHGYNEDNLCDGSEREIDVILLLLSHAGHGSCAATTRQRGLLVSRKVNALKPTFWSQAANIKSAVYLLCSNTLLDQAESVFFHVFSPGPSHAIESPVCFFLLWSPSTFAVQTQRTADLLMNIPWPSM